jgi:hypothetical protein
VTKEELGMISSCTGRAPADGRFVTKEGLGMISSCTGCAPADGRFVISSQRASVASYS